MKQTFLLVEGQSSALNISIVILRWDVCRNCLCFSKLVGHVLQITDNKTPGNILLNLQLQPGSSSATHAASPLIVKVITIINHHVQHFKLTAKLANTAFTAAC